MRYHKIPTVWQRDPETKFKTLIPGAWATPELQLLKDIGWVFTEKVDGTNIRVIWDGEAVEFWGRGDNAQIPPHLLAYLQGHFTADRLRAGLEGPCILYGEGYGPKIQKGGGDYRDTPGFILFDVWAGMWLEQDTVYNIGAGLEVPIVPIVGVGTLYGAISMAQSGRFSSALRESPPEGIVMRPMRELLDRRGNRIIAKVKLKDFQRPTP